MKDETAMTIGLFLLIIGYVFWYFAAKVRINGASGEKISFFVFLGFGFSVGGFNFIIDCAKMNDFQVFMSSFMLLGYMFICLVASNSLINGTYPKD